MSELRIFHSDSEERKIFQPKLNSLACERPAPRGKYVNGTSTTLNPLAYALTRISSCTSKFEDVSSSSAKTLRRYRRNPLDISSTGIESIRRNNWFRNQLVERRIKSE